MRSCRLGRYAIVPATFLLSAALLAGSATAQPTGGGVVDTLLESIGDDGLTLEASTAGTPQVTTDPTGDFEHVSGQRPRFTEPHFDVVELDAMGTIAPGGEFASVFPRDAGPAWCAEDGPAPPGGLMTVCPRGQTQTSFDSGATLLEIRTAGPIPTAPPARCGYAIWALDPNGPAPFRAPEGDADAGNGFNQGWAVFYDTTTTRWIPYRFTDPGPTGYQRAFDDAPFVAIAENEIAFWVPADQAANVTEINGWGFCLEEAGDTSARNSGSDQTGRTSFDAEALPTFELVVRVLSAVAPSSAVGSAWARSPPRPPSRRR